MATFLGIDAGRSVVRVALVRTAVRRIAIEALREVPVEEGSTATEALRQAIQGLKVDAAAIALSGERSTYRRVELPAAAQKELASVLPFELEATLPFELSEAVYDYKVGKKGAGEGATLPIFVALARSADVLERISLVREALGQEPERVGSGALPLLHLGNVLPGFGVAAAQPEAPVALLEVAEGCSDFVVAQGGEPVFARTLSRGLQHLPEGAAAWARELKQTIASYRVAGGAPLAGIHLVGSGASLQGAEEFLAQEAGLSLLPLPEPKLEGLSEAHKSQLPTFAKALGLALGMASKARGIDLRRGGLEQVRSYPFLREKTPLLAGLFAAVTVSLAFSVGVSLRSLDAEEAALRLQLEATTQEVLGEGTTDQEKARQLLEQGPGATDEDPLPKVDAFDVMVALSEAVPEGVVHDVVDLDVNRGRVTLQGTVPTNKDAETIAEKLKGRPCFKDVKIARTSQFGEDKQKYVLEFELKCEDPKKKKAEGGGEATPSDSAHPAEDKPSKDSGR